LIVSDFGAHVGVALNIQDYLKIKAAAAFLGVSVNTLRNWERTGELATYRHPINRWLSAL
jgi:MerR family regulatory protein